MSNAKHIGLNEVNGAKVVVPDVQGLSIRRDWNGAVEVDIREIDNGYILGYCSVEPGGPRGPTFYKDSSQLVDALSVLLTNTFNSEV